MKINSIYLGDCFSVLKKFNNDSVDYSFTSPPYNLENSIRPKSENNKSRTKKVYKGYADDLRKEEYDKFLRCIINELIRVTKNQVFFNIQYLSKTKSTIFKILGDYEKYIKDVLIWHKKVANPAIGKNVLTHNYEFIMVFDKINNNRGYKIEFDRKGTATTCFTEHTNSFVNKERFACEGNFAVMSIQVARRIIKIFTKEGDLILDPFMGSGTTAIACKESNRNFIGIEKDSKTFSIAKKRIKDFDNNKIKNITLL